MGMCQDARSTLLRSEVFHGFFTRIIHSSGKTSKCSVRLAGRET
jgi:hypothetical protein